MNPAPMPSITALYAGLLGVLLVALAMRVSGFRGRLRVGLGDGGHAALARAIRVHANAVEWIVPMLVLLLLAELNRASPILLHVCGATFLAARLAHAAGLSRSAEFTPDRFAGAAITILIVLVLSLWNLAAFLRPLLR